MTPATAGFILVGGRSSRFGVDKALLDWHGRPLVLHVAEQVRQAAGSVTLVGAPERYSHLGLPVIPDPVSGFGPLAGLAALLDHSTAAFNLVVACDMPNLTAAFLAGLLHAAAASDPDILLPHAPSGLPEPLCAVYSLRCRPAIHDAVARGVHKMTDAFAGLHVLSHPVADATIFANLNTPADLPLPPPRRVS